MSIFHSKIIRPLVHPIHKGLFCSRNMLCHGYTGVISRSNHNTFDHGFRILCLSLFQKYLRPSHGSGVGTGGNGILQMQGSLTDSIKDQDQRHDLCNTGRASSGVRIPGIDHCTGFFFHKDCTRRFDQLLCFSAILSFSPDTNRCQSQA